MSTSGEEPSPNWLELPRDITASILVRLGAIEILNNAQWVCSKWRSICKEPSMWKTIVMINEDNLWNMENDLEFMCRQAVDRSCGGLVSMCIVKFGTDELLSYITARCTRVKCLQLVRCYRISDEGLYHAATKLSMLEALELSHCFFSANTLEAVGLHCLPLKWLKLNKWRRRYPRIEDDEEALVIAKTMPNLCHLHLMSNTLTDMGLKAILDGCPLLEFLDLRRCFNVDLSGELGKRCAEQVRDVRRPFDGYDFDEERRLEEEEYYCDQLNSCDFDHDSD